MKITLLYKSQVLSQYTERVVLRKGNESHLRCTAHIGKLVTGTYTKFDMSFMQT